MHRIDTPQNVSGAFSSGNPVAGVNGTIVGHDWLNAVQEELAGFIEGESLTLDKADNTQLIEALEAFVDRLIGREFAFTATEDLTALEPFLVRDVFGVAKEAVLNTNPGVLLTRGKFSALPKDSADNITAGDRVYWNHTNREITTDGTGAVSVGYADEDAAPATTTINVVLTGPPNL